MNSSSYKYDSAFFRSRNKFGMTIDRVEAQWHQLVDLKKSFLVKTQTPDAVILNLFRDLKNFTSIRTSLL